MSVIYRHDLCDLPTSLTNKRTPALAMIVVAHKSSPGAAYGLSWNSFIPESSGTLPNGSEK